jgi:N-acetylmuramoyl-L-alanine amidase
VAKGNTARGAETYTLGLHRTTENLEVAKKENSVILIEDNYEQRYAGFNPNSAESYIMFEFLQDKNMEQSVQFATLIQRQFKNTAHRADKGVHQAGFLVLRATSMPSVLVELGYISTPDEE